MAVTIDINANPKGFESGLDSMRAKVNGFATHLGGLGTKIAAGMGAERLFEKAFDALRDGIEDIKQFKDELEDVQASLGVSADEAQRFSYAMKRADADSGETLKAMLKLRTLAGEAVAGDPNAKEAFANLGIDEKAFAAQSLTEQVLTLSDAFKELSKNGAASDVALQFLEVMGTKNRSVLKLLGRDRDTLARDMSDTKVIGDDTLAKLDEAKEAKVADETAARAAMANSGAAEQILNAESVGRTAKQGATSVLANSIEGVVQLVDTANWLADKLSFGLTGYDPMSARGKRIAKEEAEKELAAHPERAAFTNPLTTVKSAVTAMGGGNKALTGTGTTEKMFGNASERAAMAERQHEMDFRNSQLLQVNLDEKLKALTGERLRILTAATAEKDPKKAFDLLMKGKGMESEIMSIGKELNAPSNLTVKAGHIAEMGGGGPMATFGGMEMKITESTNYLKEIRDRILGPGGDFFFTPGHIAKGEGPNMPAGVYPAARPVSVDNFDKER